MNEQKANSVLKWGLAGAVLIASALVLCPGKKQEKLETQIQPVSQVQPIQKIQIPQQRQLYIVKEGDYLSGIVYNELGLRGRNIYTKCLDIQAKNNLGSERDISKVVNGELVPGKDGFVDLIYLGEKIILD